MTSNIGSSIIQDNFEKMGETPNFDDIVKTKDEVFNLLKHTVRPEFLNRVDEVIMFWPLTHTDIRRVVDIQFKIIQDIVKNNQIDLVATDQSLDYLAKIGHDPVFGARPLKRIMQKLVLNELSKQILAGKVKKNTTLKMDIDDNNTIIFKIV
jgi:ATP-dependent Clp protease ATP-binding subunit ClpB